MDSYQHPTSELELVGILDKDSKKKGQKLGGIPVWVHMMICLNQPNAIKIERVYRCDSVVLTRREYERILQMCNKLGVKCYKMPEG